MFRVDEAKWAPTFAQSPKIRMASIRDSAGQEFNGVQFIELKLSSSAGFYSVVAGAEVNVEPASVGTSIGEIETSVSPSANSGMPYSETSAADTSGGASVVASVGASVVTGPQQQQQQQGEGSGAGSGSTCSGAGSA